MSRELDKVRQAIVPRERDQVMPFSEPLTPQRGFVAFRYSSTEISSQGNGLHVKMKETRFQDGKLVSEECEGMLDRNAYNRMVTEAQTYFFKQMAGMVGLLFAPFFTKNSQRRND